MQDGDVRIERRHCGEFLAGERTFDAPDARIRLVQVVVQIAAQQAERQPRRTCTERRDHPRVAVFVEFEPAPDVVSDSPHLVDIHSSGSSQRSRCFSLADCTYSRAVFEARMIVS